MLIFLHRLIELVLGTAVDPSTYQDLDKRKVTSAQLMSKEGPSYTDINTADNPIVWDILLGVQSTLAVLTKLSKATITNHISNYGEPGSSVERATFEIYKDGAFKSSNYSLNDLYVGYDGGLTEDAFKNWWWRGMMEAVIEALGKTAVNVAEKDATPENVLQILTGRKAKKIPGAKADDLFKYTKKANFTPIIVGGVGMGSGPVYQVVKYAEGDERDTAVVTYMMIYDRQWVEHSATIWEIAQWGVNDLYFLEDEGSVP
ncbi:uncharacterized protein L199_001667 [Kwoniella botswanensis]|uniref:uncharacterized protein n=1 Tax=Kwoniella botswanensis TaxID=1268659 RepID=UPI00315CD7C4